MSSLHLARLLFVYDNSTIIVDIINNIKTDKTAQNSNRHGLETTAATRANCEMPKWFSIAAVAAMVAGTTTIRNFTSLTELNYP